MSIVSEKMIFVFFYFNPVTSTFLVFLFLFQEKAKICIYLVSFISRHLIIMDLQKYDSIKRG